MHQSTAYPGRYLMKRPGAKIYDDHLDAPVVIAASTSQVAIPACPDCGTATTRNDNRSRRCPHCGQVSFLSISSIGQCVRWNFSPTIYHVAVTSTPKPKRTKGRPILASSIEREQRRARQRQRYHAARLADLRARHAAGASIAQLAAHYQTTPAQITQWLNA